jgi:hypothetical protein
LGIAQLEIQKEACGGDNTRNSLLKQKLKQRWINGYIVPETAGATMRVENPEVAVQHDQDDLMNAEIALLTFREPENK